MVYHIIVPYEHTGTEVVVIDHRDLVRFFEYFFIASGFGGRPFQGLIRTGDSAFQLDVKVVMLPKLNDSFGKVHIDAESHTSNKMVIAIFKIISNSASKGLDILIVIGSFFWVCKRHENTGAEYCKSRPIKEEALEKAFVRALNELIGDKEQILEKLQSAIVSEITDSCATAINEVSAEIEKLQEQMMELLTIRNNGEITDKEYEHQSQQVGMKIDQLLMRKEEILSEQGKVQLASYRIEEVTKLLQTGKILEEFDRVMFKSLVRKITVLSNKEIEIEFECGITVRETL